MCDDATISEGKYLLRGCGLQYQTTYFFHELENEWLLTLPSSQKAEAKPINEEQNVIYS